ncbi:MAG: thioredoxin domain-containing protein [Cellvibrionaceae bacterium]
MPEISNTLHEATSLYLLQHKDNPVAWQQWSDPVLALAKKQDKPILLSIGYSACHWCHAMSRESFGDSAIAELMNDRFVNIKVDREERPDLDDIYQTAHQLLTGQAGAWPLTIFLCPRTNIPFLAGTYFSKESHNGRLGFSELLEKVSDYYQTRGPDFLETIDKIKLSYKTLIRNEKTSDPDAELNNIPIEKSIVDIFKEADLVNGGFGPAPKFPMPTRLERLLVTQYYPNEWKDVSSEHLKKSLLIMSRSGIQDQIGGGFFRYSTDAKWMIPHFEKMLYDNALLLGLYSRASKVFPEIEEFSEAAKNIARWALDDMRSRQGVFYSSLDAEADGAEGAYYLWDIQQITKDLTPVEQGVVHAVFDLDKYANFDGQWHLHRDREWGVIAAELEIDLESLLTHYNKILEKLRIQRLDRKKPIRDSKIITSWNALMLGSLAIAAREFGYREYLTAAQKTADFIRENLWINKRLYATWQDGEPKIGAFLNDYVFLMDALIKLLRCQWRDEDYRFLCLLGESLIDNYEDKDHGGFYFTHHDHEKLIYRSKPFYDSVLPSGNGMAAKVLGRLGHLCAEPRYLESAKKTLLSGWSSMLRQPKNHNTLLISLSEYLHCPPQVLLKGNQGMAFWHNEIYKQYGDRVHCYWIPEESEIHPPELFLLENNQGLVCAGGHCLEPQSKLDDLLSQLAGVVEGKIIPEEID